MAGKDYVVYEETTGWPWWAAGFVGVAVVAAAAMALLDATRGLATARVDVLVRGALIAGGVLLLGLIVRTLFGRLRVVVTRTSLRLTFGYTSLIEKLVTFDEIEDVDPVRYSPIREFGGWGLRYGGGRKRAWTVRGDGAVVLTLDDGVRLYVGSDDPERLAERILTAMARARRASSEGDEERGAGGWQAPEERPPTGDEDGEGEVEARDEGDRQEGDEPDEDGSDEEPPAPGPRDWEPPGWGGGPRGA
ncbi:MAG: hypothetical protein PVI57_24325 [Gemmatimonadota bacterium]|jgi:hypothetical protein